MVTFLEMVKANGFESINEYLDSMKGFAITDAPDFTAVEIEKIRAAEARTASCLGEI